MRIIIAIIVSISTFGFFYLLGCFYNANFDITTWSEFSRYCISFLGGMFSPLFGLLNYFRYRL